jgi:hypothetical protein
VAINSYSSNIPGVNAMGDALAEDFAIDGLTLQRHAGDGVGDHLVWRTPAWAGLPGERVVLIGHLVYGAVLGGIYGAEAEVRVARTA